MKKFIPGQIIKTSTTKKGRTVTFSYPKWEDLDEMTNFINAVSKEDTFIGFSGETVSREDEGKYLASLFPKIENNDLVVVHAFIDGKLAGRSDVYRDLSMKERQKHVGILGLIVGREYRSEGLGEELIRVTIEQAKLTIPGLRIIKLEVFGTNNIAQSLYKKVGFKESGRIPQGILYKGEYIDDIAMYYPIVERDAETSSA
jgi:RimJ/RimL family protein N-acetyltransferase